MSKQDIERMRQWLDMARADINSADNVTNNDMREHFTLSAVNWLYKTLKTLVDAEEKRTA